MEYNDDNGYAPLLGLHKGRALEYNVCEWWDGQWWYGLLKLDSFYGNVATYYWTGKKFSNFEDARNTALVKHCVYYAIPYKLNDFKGIDGFDGYMRDICAKC